MTTPTERELSNAAFALEKLWELDENRLEPGVDYAINVPLAIRKTDNTPEKLFKFVSNKAGKIPTYQLFYRLLDNYIPETGIPEKVDDEELEENKAFIKACLKTSPFIYTFNYLKAKGIFKNLTEFEQALHKLWFKFYARESKNDSSAFEHTFIGEVRDGSAKGFHNWIMLYFYEKSGKIDYEGYIQDKRDRSKEPDPNSHVITLRFNFGGAKKQFSTSFIGTSPEFELSMYTLLFYLNRQDTKVTFEDVDLNIKVYPYHEHGNGEKLLGAAYPMLLNHH